MGSGSVNKMEGGGGMKREFRGKAVVRVTVWT